MKSCIFHVIEYQYCGLPHAHFFFCLNNAHDIDTNNHEDLIAFVDKKNIVELPQFDWDEFQNIHWWDTENELTDEYKAKALKMVRMHNIYNCTITVNGCKKIYLKVQMWL